MISPVKKRRRQEAEPDKEVKDELMIDSWAANELPLRAGENMNEDDLLLIEKGLNF